MAFVNQLNSSNVCKRRSIQIQFNLIHLTQENDVCDFPQGHEDAATSSTKLINVYERRSTNSSSTSTKDVQQIHLSMSARHRTHLQCLPETLDEFIHWQEFIHQQIQIKQFIRKRTRIANFLIAWEQQSPEFINVYQRRSTKFIRRLQEQRLGKTFNKIQSSRIHSIKFIQRIRKTFNNQQNSSSTSTKEVRQNSFFNRFIQRLWETFNKIQRRFNQFNSSNVYEGRSI